MELMEGSLRTLHPALEDGTDRGFRNVGKPQSDAAEIPKRIHTTLNREFALQEAMDLS